MRPSHIARKAFGVALILLPVLIALVWWATQGAIPVRVIHHDAPPVGFDMFTRIKPVSAVTVRTSGTCDGDGTTGYRVQVLYVRTVDMVSRYAEYLASFQTWALETDAVFSASAIETGGTRHVRYVHDAGCNPIVTEVVLPSGSLSDFMPMVSALSNVGYNRTDRKYMNFVEGNAWCGISDWQSDDRADIALNMNNTGPHYTYIGNTCWSTTVAAHEIMHTLGAVQVSAPHSSQETHCWDMDDLMCRPTNGWPVQQICAWQGYLHFDCNHDDYYSTAPLAGSYLATHWNAANSKFLIGAPQPLPTPTPCVRGKSGKPCK